MTDDKIIVALMTCPTVDEAARSLNITRAAIYKRMKNDDFMQKYKLYRTEVLTQAAAYVQSVAGLAIQKLVDIMQDPDTAKQIQVNAADALLRNCYRMTEQVDTLSRIDELERRTKQYEQIIDET